MSTFRYNLNGRWFKGNCHIHTPASDGGTSVAGLSAMYAGQGYDFLCRTDHWVASDVAADTEEYPLLWLDGVELHGRDYGDSYYHVLCLGKFTGLDERMGIVAGMEAVRAQGGMVIMAHPAWLGNTLADAQRYGFHGVEVYNHVCRWLNGKGDGLVYWNAVLQHAPQTLALAVDDAHCRPEHPGWNGGWVMVNAPERTREAIMAALWQGHFYSTCGPIIASLEYDGENMTVYSSPVQFARLVGPTHHGARVGSFDGHTLTEATFKIPPEWAYAYLELEDTCGRRAWTNTLLV